jgi:hypothetical protein
MWLNFQGNGPLSSSSSALRAYFLPWARKIKDSRQPKSFGRKEGPFTRKYDIKPKEQPPEEEDDGSRF